MSLGSVNTKHVERREYDVIVVGSGGAGTAAARSAADAGARVLIVSKDPMMCSDSKISGGIVTVRASGTESDTVEVLNANVRMGGDDIADPTLTRIFAEESKPSYEWLQSHGLRPDFDPQTGKPVIFPGPLGGHNRARSVIHENGGLDYAHACWNAVMRKGSIEYLEDAWFLDVYQRGLGEQIPGGEILGGLIYHAGGSKFISVKAPSVVLACGGLTTIFFPQQFTMKGNTGDAYAIAARAGATMVDMEQIQFIAFAIASPKSYEGIGVAEPAMTGFLGRLLDKDGNKIMGELAVRTRAECAAAIAKAVAEGRGTENDACYLDMTQNAKGEAGKLFKQIMEAKGDEMLIPVKGAMGPKAAKFETLWEVKPTGHYLNGGIHVNEQTEVLSVTGDAIAGLYAAGQAMGGLHGSNRLGSTSLTECVVFGRRSGEGAAAHSSTSLPVDWQQVESAETILLERYSRPLGSSGKNFPLHLNRALQKACREGVGPARNGKGLQKTLESLNEVSKQFNDVKVSEGLEWNQGLINYIEGQNMLFCAKTIAMSALARPVSVGSHFRTDSRRQSSEQVYSLTCRLQQDEIVLGNIPRTASPLLERIKVNADRLLRLNMLKVINRLPEKLRDRVLVKAWRKNAGAILDAINEEAAA
jgi:succinate dehydrogenase/fumarate reductase flavoprotein subunit